MDSPEGKIYRNVDDLKVVLSRLREQGKKIVFTNGCFDIVHRGHCEYLYKARQLGDFLVVGVNSNKSVRGLKGVGRPIIDLEGRMYVLACFYFVDAVIPFDEPTPIKLILAIRPDILVKGADYEIDEIVGAKEVMGWGGKVERIPLVEGYSTSEIINKIKNEIPD